MNTFDKSLLEDTGGYYTRSRTKPPVIQENEPLLNGMGKYFLCPFCFEFVLIFKL